MLYRTILAIVLFLCVSLSHAVPNSPDEYVKIFQAGTQFDKEKAAESLAWAGISSPKLFDIIEKEVLDRYASTRDKVGANYISWLVKSLSFSGNEKYRATIITVTKKAASSKVKKYAKAALIELPKYTEYNLVMAPKAWPEFEHPSKNERFINMMKSDETDLLRLAAKRVHYSHNYDAAILEELNATIEKNYKKAMGADRIDAVAWLCKALAGSRSKDYKATIESVGKTAKEKKLRAYATKYLRYYNK